MAMVAALMAEEGQEVEEKAVALLRGRECTGCTRRRRTCCAMAEDCLRTSSRRQEASAVVAMETMMAAMAAQVEVVMAEGGMAMVVATEMEAAPEEAQTEGVVVEPAQGWPAAPVARSAKVAVAAM